MALYLGIDFGTSGARLAVIDADTQLLTEASGRFGTAKDWIATWREALFNLIGQVPEELRREVGAIAINGTSSTVLLCDAVGNPVTPPLLYNDPAGASELETLRQFFSLPHLTDASCKDTVLSATSV
ncbi:hypothetical protein [Leptothermofonsia sp. ETS-13]|uniref:hypothetical protein n=1 Tax=Leptothermofonsia sp. ETS-13 TaxID=3035696 RepID=UPI003BA39762